MDGTLEDRLAALERAVTDGDHDCSALAEGAATADRVADLEGEFADLADRVAELEAATQALRGYVGNVRSVNSEVEQRADLALSKAEATRRALDQLRSRDAGGPAPTTPERTGHGEGNPTDNDTEDIRRGSLDTREHLPERCTRCERPFTDGEGLHPDTDTTGTETSGDVADTAGLDGLREFTDPREDDLGAVVGTETDGGYAEPTADGSGTTPPKEAEDESETGVLSRIRSLL